MNLDLSRRGSALVIVAHPDDETIWMGGVILANPEIKWTIFSLCRKNDEDRAPRFREAAKNYSAQGIMADLEDDNDRMSIKKLSESAGKLILENLSECSFDYIFTHAKEGEYGNKRHKSVHLAVRKLLQAQKLQAKNTHWFAYQMDKSGQCAIPQKKSDFEIKLPKNIFNQKLDLIQKVYGFLSDSFESKSCSRIETFNLMR